MSFPSGDSSRCSTRRSALDRTDALRRPYAGQRDAGLGAEASDRRLHRARPASWAFGYNPFIASWSPYHGAAYAVVEAAAKVVAAGARYDRMRYSYQEYFERMTKNPESWGKPLGALLGALKMQVELGLPSIGGKDSMSGTFQHINVPPMLMAFGITTVDAERSSRPTSRRPAAASTSCAILRRRITCPTRCS